MYSIEEKQRAIESYIANHYNAEKMVKELGIHSELHLLIGIGLIIHPKGKTRKEK